MLHRGSISIIMRSSIIRDNYEFRVNSYEYASYIIEYARFTNSL